MPTWNRDTVRGYGDMLERVTGLRVGGQCRQDGYVPAYGSSDSLHFERNGCRALDLFGPDDKLRAFEAWAKSTNAFAEVLYTGVPGHGPGMGGTRHLHLGFPEDGDLPTPSAYNADFGGALGDVIGAVSDPAAAAASGVAAALGGLLPDLRDTGLRLAFVLGGAALIVVGGYRAVTSDRR